MAYFQNFETLVYDVVGDGNPKLFTHLLRRVKINDLVKDNVLLFDFYQVKPGEKPEDVAFDFYGSAELHWLVLYANNIVDRYHQWPQNQNQFLAYLKDKYSNVDATHHYEISQTSGDTTIKIDIGTDNTDYPTASIVTNYEYEEDLQDKKRKIRLLDPAYIEPFVAEFEALMEESLS